MYWPRRALVASSLALALLSACGKDGGGSGDTAVQTCDADGRVALGRYLAQNDVWHPQTGYSQCVEVSNVSGNSIDARFEATWPADPANGPRGFPHVKLGTGPWTTDPVTSTLPRAIGYLYQLTVAGDYDMSRTEEADLEIRTWVTSDVVRPSGSDHLTIVAEVWVHVHSAGGRASSIPVIARNVEVGGRTYDLRYSETTWTTPVRSFYEFTPTSDDLPDVGSFALDLVPFLEVVQDDGLVVNTNYVSAVDVGVVFGEGTAVDELTGLTVTAPLGELGH